MGKELQTFLDFPPMLTRRELQPRRRQGGDGEEDAGSSNRRPRARANKEPALLRAAREGRPFIVGGVARPDAPASRVGEQGGCADPARC